MFKRLFYKSLHIKRSYSSALYITANKAHENFRVLTPYIDFEERMQQKSELETNITLRGLQIDVNKLESYWNFYKTIDNTKEQLEANRTYIGSRITELMKDPEKNKQEIDKLKVHINLIKNDIKNVKDYLYGIEEHAMEQVLSLPNILHSKTPQEIEKVIHTYLEKPDFKADSHANIAKQNNLVEFVDNVCFLKNNAALFEIDTLNYFNNFLSSKNFVQFSNADFVRSLIIEGCGTNFQDTDKILTLEDKDDDKNHELNRLHLVGGASLYSFMAYFTKHILEKSQLPLTCYALGRKYQPANSDSVTLFKLAQETCVQLFVAMPEDDDCLNATIDTIIKHVTDLYEGLGYHFRLVFVPAKCLHVSETLHMSVQMYSPFLQDYVEVAYVSVNDEYLSKRLLFTYNDGKDKRFVKVLSGKLFSVQKFFGCVLEQSKSEKELLNDLLFLRKNNT